MYTVTIPATAQPIVIQTEKLTTVKAINAALKTANVTATVTVNKTLDLNAAPKPRSAAQLAADQKRREAAAAQKKANEAAKKKGQK